jgi:hypothetical protein
MKRTPNATQRTLRAQSIFSLLFISAIRVIRGLNPSFEINRIAFAAILVLSSLLLPATTASAGTPTPVVSAEVVIHLLDTGGQPLTGMKANLTLLRYSKTVEEFQFGSCITDGTGSCAIMVSDPPRLRSGRIEGFIDLGNSGRQLIGWDGQRFEIILQLDPDGKLATPLPPLDLPYEGQTEKPTDTPLFTATSAPRPTLPPTCTATGFPSTATPAPPAADESTEPTLAPTPGSAAVTTPTPATPALPSEGNRQLIRVWIGLGLALFILLGIACRALFYYQRRSDR